MGRQKPPQDYQKLLALKRGSSTPMVTSNRLKLRDIYFGTPDAADEIDTATAETQRYFYDTFFIPAGLLLDEFIKGQKFLVYGQKGTGKTSLLLYLQEKIVLDAVSKVRPELFRFSREFPKEIYEDVRTAFLDNRFDAEESRGDIYRDLDYEDVWTFIILRRISQVAEAGGFFVKGPELNAFIAFMGSISAGERKQAVLRFLPNIQRGIVRLSQDLRGDFAPDFENPDTKELSFHRYAEHAIKLFSKLRAVPGRPFYLLFDEIDPRTGSGTMFELDCILIRDLVVVLRRLNTVSKADQKGVFLIAAVRSEILQKVERLGKEIHKRFEQFGYCMNWGDLGRVDISHPLIQMICRKIAYSEKRAGILTAEIGQIEEYIWPRYFRKNKLEQMDPKLLMDWTWFKPRDFVRLFGICKEADGDVSEISEGLINRVQKRYSSRSWSEISSQLTLFIDPFCIDGLERALTVFQREFSLDEFKTRLNAYAKNSTQTARLVQRHEAADVLDLLYNAGAIGNISASKVRFAHRGDAELDLNGQIYVHRALLPHFTISKGRPKRS